MENKIIRLKIIKFIKIKIKIKISKNKKCSRILNNYKINKNKLKISKKEYLEAVIQCKIFF